VIRGRRITIMTGERRYRAGEEIRVHHVMEATEPGIDVYVMGPKQVTDETVNGELRTAAGPPSADPFRPSEYDGRVVPGPAIDFNYEVTAYRFTRPGAYQILWKPGEWKSNVLEIEVVR